MNKYGVGGRFMKDCKNAYLETKNSKTLKSRFSIQN